MSDKIDTVREALEEAANIANRFGDCPGSFVADRIMEFAADTDATPSPLMAAGEAAPQASAESAQSDLPVWQQIQLGLLLGMMADWRNADHEDSLRLSRSDVIAIIEGFKARPTSPQPSRIDAAAEPTRATTDSS